MKKCLSKSIFLYGFSACLYLVSHTLAFAIDAPQNLSVSLQSDGQASLSWSLVEDATGYNIYRDDAYLTTVDGSVSTFSDSQTGSSYYLTAVNNNANPADFSVRGETVLADSGGGGSAGGFVSGCGVLPSHAQVTSALQTSIAPTGGPGNGGFDLHMWASVVDRDGKVCVVTRSGDDRGAQWPGSRVISAQKANTANSFSLPGLALSTANLWAATQPGGSLFGLQFSNPVDTAAAYGDVNHGGGSAAEYGSAGDPMVGRFIGGVNVFGGGLALYNSSGSIVGAIGVSGDTSCADHNIAWRLRAALNLDFVPGGVGETSLPDNINYAGAGGNSALQNDFVHPVCAIAGNDNVSSVSANLPEVRVIP